VTTTVDDSKPLIILALFLLSAFFSGSETALFSLSRVYLKKIENEDTKGNMRILKLLRNPRRLLITLLLGNTFVNMGISSLSALWVLEESGLSQRLEPSAVVALQIGITTILLLLFGELIPKLLALATAASISRIVCLPIMGLQYILSPLIWFFDRFGSLLAHKTKGSGQNSHAFTSREFENLIHSDSSNHNLDEHEKRMLVGLFRFKDAQISEIMVPRVRIVAIEENCSLEDLQGLIVETGFSRIPVYRESIDDIIGMVYVKDLLLFPEKKTMSDLIRPVWFITENMKVENLLNQFKSKKQQFAVVVDEYGGTSGIITLEDIMEEIVGEIRDEYDADEVPELIKTENNTYLVAGTLNIRQFNHEFDTDIDPELYDNVAEFLLEHFNHVPAINESMDLEHGLRLTVTDADEKSIKQICLEFLEGS